jgi:urea transport system substrate-binding protein
MGMAIKRRDFLKGTAAAGAAASVGFPHIWLKDYGLARAANGEIKVGILFSLTGTTAIIEESLHKATLLAIEEINEAGGINGMRIVPVEEDPASDPATFADRARKLVVGDRCVSVFGSYTSASRKAVLPVFERRDNLYWYPTLYEGRECSKNVIYTGAVPNQQQDEFIPWLFEKFGPRFYLIGSNYIYPREENNYCKKLLADLGGEVVEEEYVPLGHSEFSSVINKIRSTQPNVLFSTVVGDSVVALHRQYRSAGLDPDKMPMASLTTSENEIAAMGGDAAAGHFTSAPYFMVHSRKRTRLSWTHICVAGGRTRSRISYPSRHTSKSTCSSRRWRSWPPATSRPRPSGKRSRARNSSRRKDGCISSGRTCTPGCGPRSPSPSRTGSSRCWWRVRSGWHPTRMPPTPTSTVQKRAWSKLNRPG